MRKQQKIWLEEHKTAASLPSEMSTASVQEPSNYVVAFYEFLKRQGLKRGKVVDIGAGKGRNSLYMAKQGFEVHAMDYIPEAVDFIKASSTLQKINVETYYSAIDGEWPFPDNFFDVAIDCFASIDIETSSGREKYKKELMRTLKPGGYALIVVVSSDDEIEAELIKNSPGLEKNSSIWRNGKFQKNYDEGELRDFYQGFKIVEFKKVHKRAYKLGKDFNASNFELILQKI